MLLGSARKLQLVHKIADNLHAEPVKLSSLTSSTSGELQPADAMQEGLAPHQQLAAFKIAHLSEQHERVTNHEDSCPASEEGHCSREEMLLDLHRRRDGHDDGDAGTCTEHVRGFGRSAQSRAFATGSGSIRSKGRDGMGQTWQPPPHAW